MARPVTDYMIFFYTLMLSEEFPGLCSQGDPRKERIYSIDYAACSSETPSSLRTQVVYSYL